MEAKVKVRFAPSPTGGLHPGNARVAIFNWLFARHFNGSYVIRVEDTDEERSSRDFEKSIMEDLKWLGIDWDEDPVRQSDRISKYKGVSQRLMDSGYLYKCFCTEEELEEERLSQIKSGKPPRYSTKCKSLGDESEEAFALRFDVQKFIDEINKGDTDIGFIDIIRKNEKLSMPVDSIGDFVVIKKSGVPTYNFAVVVDDIDMGITHIFRGEDHISNTFRQVMVFMALGFDYESLPKFGHIPMLLASDRSKLSKRNGGVPIHEYNLMGFLPEAVFNHLAFIGGSFKDFLETDTVDDLIKKFDYTRTSVAPSVYDVDKLKHINSKFISVKNTKDILAYLKENIVLKNSGRNFSDYYEVMKRYYDDKTIYDIVHFLKIGTKTLVDIIKELDAFIPLRVKDDSIYSFDTEQLNLLNTVYEGYIVTNKKISGKHWEPFKDDMLKLSGISKGKLFKTLRVIFTGRQMGPALDNMMQLMNDKVIFDRIQRLKSVLG